MNLRLLAIAFVTVLGFANISALTEWPEVNVAHNKYISSSGARLADDARCKYNEESNEIVCESDGEELTITNIEARVVSSTGTPGWLEFDNYIGQTAGTIGNGLAGSGRKTIFLKK